MNRSKKKKKKRKLVLVELPATFSIKYYIILKTKGSKYFGMEFFTGIYALKVCGHNFKRNDELNQQLVHKHNIDVKWIFCTEDNCESKFQTNRTLKRHLMKKDNIDFFLQKRNDVKNKVERNSNAKRKYLLHANNSDKEWDSGVVEWFRCTEPNCKGKFQHSYN